MCKRYELVHVYFVSCFTVASEALPSETQDNIMASNGKYRLLYFYSRIENSVYQRTSSCVGIVCLSAVNIAENSIRIVYLNIIEFDLY